MNRKLSLLFKGFISLFLLASFNHAIAAKADFEKKLNSETFDGLKWRNIGPAFMSGRIADIDIDPNNKNIWYVGVGSGGVWKTTNAGTTWTPLFDEQDVYSIGTVTIDPNNSSTIWVGSGENVSGRHVGFGDGVYVSHDAGKTWLHKGLKNSEHISEIIVHPTNPNIVWVAAQGPLWSKGGQRGLFKSVDGGGNWKRVLGDNKWVGVTDLAIDPREPNRLYAVTWQRHRTVAALVDGGPGTGIHRSEDGGETWIQLNESGDKKQTKLSKKSGLPTSDMGKIGLAISPQNPDILYAAIELDRRKGAVYRSEDRGVSWTKQSEAVAGGTGPHYYQELYASPHRFEQIFLANVRMLQSDDGGKTFNAMAEEHKHSDNHSLTFAAGDKDYMLMGSDGGIYESFDNGENWRFISNLPITQYYKLAVDDAEPFYNVFGGTQDNGTHGGPSRTDNANGIRSADWEMVLFADGHQPATEPGNPDIMYAEWQQGNLMRVDRTNGELVYIQPQPDAGEPEERFNWDAPILVSPHKSSRIFHASQRVWQSDDRGDTWTAISPDLTKNLDRIEQPIMDGKPGWDSAWDMWAMSKYSTITSLAESPIKAGLIYAGTDDGLIQVTENGGKSWRKIEVEDLGVPETAFVNDIKADLFDPNTVYVALDNHKFGDYKPYLVVSRDRGKSWRSIASDLPAKHLVWRIVQDHKAKNLMFAATEFGVFFTINGGKKWIELNAGMPTIALRDIAIQRRENDLVVASFGRGFFILDDYSALRDISEKNFEKAAHIFPTRDAWWYIQQGPLSRFERNGYQGANHYSADNPAFGAEFTYYIKDKIQSLKEKRQAKEKPLKKKNKPINFPGWKAVEAERRQQNAEIWLTVKDENGKVVRRIKGKNKAGIHRVAWHLDLPKTDPILTTEVSENNNYIQIEYLSAPGKYSVSVSQKVDGKVTKLTDENWFEVKPLYTGALKGAGHQKVAEFWQDLRAFKIKLSGLSNTLSNAMNKVKMLEIAMAQSQLDTGSVDAKIAQVRAKLLDINHRVNGDQSRSEVYLSNVKTISNLLNVAELGTVFSSYGPTPTHKKSLAQAKTQFAKESAMLKEVVEKIIPAIEKQLADSGAPWILGQTISQ